MTVSRPRKRGSMPNRKAAYRGNKGFKHRRPFGAAAVSETGLIGSLTR
jgi:hypothetical protein